VIAARSTIAFALALLLPHGARAEEVTASGEVRFLEVSGENLYLELEVGGRTVGVELLPAVARAHRGRITKGMLLGVRGRRLKGDKQVAYVVEVREAAAVTVPGAASRKPALLIALRLRDDPPPTAPVEMIAGTGLWPPVEAEEVRRAVATARAEAVSTMLVDVGLTERWRSYREPAPHLAVIAEAAREARRLGQPLAFYLPSFELRREKRDGGEHLLACCKAWAQVTLAGAPFLKTRFEKSEFWNKPGDQALWVCPSSPWRKLFLARVREAVRRGVETVFVDVPYLQEQTCRCAHCQASFRRASGGLTIPTRALPGQASTQRFRSFRHGLLRDFFRELRATIRAERPTARLVVEESPTIEEGGTVRTGLEIGLAGEEVDVFAHEYSAGQLAPEPFGPRQALALATALALYRGLDGRRPTWVLSYAHDRRGSRRSAALHLGHDASFWETKGPEMTGTSVDRAWRRQLFGWFAKHRAVFGGSHGLAETALLYSPASRDRSGLHFQMLLRTIQTLIEARIPFRVLSTRDLAELRHHRTLVLPSVSALDATHAATLRKSGLRLLVVGDPPTLDGLGVGAQDPGLRPKRVELTGLPAALGPQPVEVRGGRVALWLSQRPGEVQLRLANLEVKPSTVEVRLRLAGIRSATALTLLGGERRLELAREGDVIRIPGIRVEDLTVLRFASAGATPPRARTP
jgi:hypothetical protein